MNTAGKFHKLLFNDHRHKSTKVFAVIFGALVIFATIPLTVFLTQKSEDITKNPKAATNVNDPCFVSGCPAIANSQQWDMAKINAPNAWDVTHGSTAVKVAVVDTGIRVLPDLVGQVGTGYSAIQPGGSTDDDYGSYGSGTGNASIIGAATNNGRDMAGINWNTTMLPVKDCGFVLNPSIGLMQLKCTSVELAAGINWAVTNGAQIIFTNETWATSDAGLDAAVANAIAHDIIVIAPVGDYAGGTYYPAHNPGVISVGATDVNDVIGSFSAHDPTLVAPGAGTTQQPGVTVLANGGCCVIQIGTGKAAAHVAGAAALLLAAGVPASQVQTALIQGAKDLGSPGYDSVYGNGRLDICGALNAAGKTCPLSGTKIGDFNGDGRVNIFDASILFSNWNSTTAPTYDLNHNGKVDIFDASILFSNWTG